MSRKSEHSLEQAVVVTQFPLRHTLESREWAIDVLKNNLNVPPRLARQRRESIEVLEGLNARERAGRVHANSSELMAAVDHMDKAAREVYVSLGRNDHPNRTADYVRDVERWCKHARSHLANIAAGDR